MGNNRHVFSKTQDKTSCFVSAPTRRIVQAANSVMFVSFVTCHHRLKDSSSVKSLLILFTPGRCSCANGMRCLFILWGSFVLAAGKIAKEEGRLDLGSTPEDGFSDCLILPPTAAELVSNPHSSRSELSDCFAWTMAACQLLLLWSLAQSCFNAAITKVRNIIGTLTAALNMLL